MSTDNPTSGKVIPRIYPFSTDSNCSRVFSMHFHGRVNQHCPCHWWRVGNLCEIDDRRGKNSPAGDNSRLAWASDWDGARIGFDPRESRKGDEIMTRRNRVVDNPESDRLPASLRWSHERTTARRNLLEPQWDQRSKNYSYWPVFIVELFSLIGRSDGCWTSFFIRFFRSGFMTVVLLRPVRRDGLASSGSALEQRIRRARICWSFGGSSRCFLVLIFFVGVGSAVVLSGRRWAPPAVVFASMISPIWKTKSNDLCWFLLSFLSLFIRSRRNEARRQTRKCASVDWRNASNQRDEPRQRNSPDQWLACYSWMRSWRSDVLRWKRRAGAHKQLWTANEEWSSAAAAIGVWSH